jgi:hypothetical protein
MSLKLTEILHTLTNEQESGLVPIDDIMRWGFSNLEYLFSMGFTKNGEYKMSLKNPPISVYLKKGIGYIVNDEKKKEEKIFNTFDKIINYFDEYQQDFDDDKINF